MTLSVIKELQSKVSMLEKSNKVLTERLGRAEHKVGVLLQWALSFPGIAASQGLAQLSSQTSSIRPTGYQPTVRKRRPAVTALNRRPIIRGKVVARSGMQRPASGTEAVPSTSQSGAKSESDSTASQGQEQGTITVQVIQGDTEELRDLEHAVIPIVESSGENEANEVVQSDNISEMEEVEVSSEAKDVKVIQIRQARYVCNICGSGYSYQHGLSRHMNAAHERKSEFMCKYCSKTFHRKDKYRQHESLCVKKLTV